MAGSWMSAIGLASALGIEVVAEVEEEWMARMPSSEKGCRFAQGFPFRAPRPGERAEPSRRAHAACTGQQDVRHTAWPTVWHCVEIERAPEADARRTSFLKATGTWPPFSSDQLDFIFFFVDWPSCCWGPRPGRFSDAAGRGYHWTMLAAFGSDPRRGEWIDLAALILGDNADLCGHLRILAG